MLNSTRRIRNSDRSDRSRASFVEPEKKLPGSRMRLFLRINQDTVVDEDDEVVFAITGHIGHSRFPGLR